MNSGHLLPSRLFHKKISQLLRIGFTLGLVACQAQLATPPLPPTLTPTTQPPMATFTPPVWALSAEMTSEALPESATASPTSTATPTTTSTTTPTPTFTATPTPTASPTDTPSPTPTATPISITLLFTGDINPGRCPAQKSIANGDFTLPYKELGPELSLADLTIGSLDGSISDISPPSPCPQTLNLIGPSRVVEGLTFAGFDLLTVATNHAKDCGRLGFGCDDRSFRDTLKHLQAAGIATVGGGETEDAARQPAFLTVGNIRFAFLGVNEIDQNTWATASTPGTAPLTEASMPRLLADIAAAKAQADVVVVLPQWGVEYTYDPEDYQLAWAGQMIDAGATLVIGNHPHLIQPIEEFRNPDGSLKGLVAYALGNFIFDQGPWRTRQGIVLQTSFSGSTLTGWSVRPTHIHSFYLVKWADPTEAQAILDRIAEANAKLPQR